MHTKMVTGMARWGSAGARWTRRASTLSPGDAGVRACLLAILGQHKAFLQGLDDDVYTFVSPLLQGSVGQHTRHSLDHLRKPLELSRALNAASARGGVDEDAALLQFDLRQRNTPVEQHRDVAIEQIEQLIEDARAIDPSKVGRRTEAAFMLSASGEQFAFDSTLSRELAFAVHHCIHHNALSKVLLRHHFPHVAVPPDFGMAPSTANYNLTHPQTEA